MTPPPISGTYPAEWTALAKIVKDEASWCCARCKHPHSPREGRTLTVHHFDGNKANCERWNLMPLITCMDKGPKRRLRIGRCLDTGGTSLASAVYLAEDLGPVGDSKPKDHSGRLFT